MEWRFVILKGSFGVLVPKTLAGGVSLVRTLIYISVVFVVLHIAIIAVLGPNTLGSVLANVLQIAAAGIAAAMAIRASRRGSGLSRSLWLLVGCAWATWAIANVGWMLHE